MDIGAFLLTNILNGLIGLALLVLGYISFNIATPKWNFNEIFNRGYISNGGLVISAFLIALGIVIAFSAG